MYCVIYSSVPDDLAAGGGERFAPALLHSCAPVTQVRTSAWLLAAPVTSCLRSTQRLYQMPIVLVEDPVELISF